MALTGDFAGLRGLIAKFKRMQAEKAATEVTKAIATYSEQEVKKAFRAGQSPEGETWAPGPYLDGLVASGKIRGGYVSRVSGLTYTLRNKARYAHYHQNGAVLRGRKRLMSGPLRKGVTRRKRVVGSGNERGNLPSRPIVPFAGRIPPKWESGYRERGHRVLSRLLGS